MDVMFEPLTKIVVAIAFSVSLSLFLLVCLYLSCSLCAFTNACVYIQGRNNTGELLHATPNPTANPPIEK